MSARVPDSSTAAPLREALARARYNVAGLRIALGGEAESSPGDAPVQARRLGDDDLAVLARLFLLGIDVAADRAGAALAPASLDQLEAAGFLATAGAGRLRSPIRISPFEGLLLAHDPEVLDDPAEDIVTGLNSAARTLASLTPRRPTRRALDLGTGCGVQALLAARHSERVVATDVNPRALAYTRLGAALNGFDQLETREGSFFDPLEGERFDLIASNPPYVISPDDRLVYRDGGLERDEVSRIAIAGAAEHLEEGGLAMVLCNWVAEPSEHWSQPLRRWLEGAGCDALLLHHITEEPVEYAAKWNLRFRRDPDAHGEVLDRWLAYYREAGIAQLATGAVALHRRGGREGLVVTAEMASGPSGKAGEHVVRMLEAAEQLAELDDDALLSTPLALVAGHRLHRERRHAEGGGYGPETVRLALDDSAGLQFEFGPAAAALLVGLDGGHAPNDLLPLLVRTLPGDVGDVRDAVITAIRKMLAEGLVTAVPPPRSG